MKIAYIIIFQYLMWQMKKNTVKIQNTLQKLKLYKYVNFKYQKNISNASLYVNKQLIIMKLIKSKVLVSIIIHAYYAIYFYLQLMQ